MIKIDSKDREMLYELSKDCRISRSALARKLKLSREVVDYRIKRLIKNEIINSFTVLPNLKKFHYSRFSFYIQLHGLTEKREEKILEFFVKHPFTDCVATSVGKWNIVLDIFARDTEHLNDIINEIMKACGKNLDQFNLSSTIYHKLMFEKYFGPVSIHKNKPDRLMTHEIDDTDKKILKILRKDARADYTGISKKIDYTYNGVKKRIQKMIKSDIIEKATIIPDKYNMGLEIYVIFINFKNIDKDKEKIIVSYLENSPSVNYIARTIGEWNIELGVFVKNSLELKKFIMELKNGFSRSIKIVDTMLIFKEYKLNSIPDGLLN